MSKGKLFCDDCDKWIDFEFEYSSDLSSTKCPICKSDNIWFGELFIGEDKGPDLVMGIGGKGQR